GEFLHHLGLQHRGDVVGGEVLLIVLQKREVQGDDPAVGGEDFPEVAGPIGGGLVDRAGVHDQQVVVRYAVRVTEGDAVVVQHRLQPVITAAELALHAEGAFFHRQVGDLGQLADAQLFGGLGAHGEAVG